MNIMHDGSRVVQLGPGRLAIEFQVARFGGLCRPGGCNRVSRTLFWGTRGTPIIRGDPA